MHYMVYIGDKINKISDMIHKREYFVINKPRQYGKTTTMYMAEEHLKEEYLVFSISFEGIGDEIFKDEAKFSEKFLEYHQKGLKQLSDYLDNKELDAGYLLIYNFNKNKEYKNEKIGVEGKEIFTVWI